MRKLLQILVLFVILCSIGTTSTFIKEKGENMALGLWNPFGINLPDYKITENLSKYIPSLSAWNNPAVAPNATGLSGGATFNQSSPAVSSPIVSSANNNPNNITTNAINSSINNGALRFYPGPLPSEGSPSGGDSELDQLRKIINDTGGDPSQRSRLAELEGMQGGGIDFEAILNRQREEANAALDRARGVRDEGLASVNEKRKQFLDTFNQGKEDITQGFQKGAGQLQRSSMGQTERNNNALRALGLGGSANVRLKGRQQQENTRALSSLQDVRGQNERANKEAYQTNTDWANAREADVNRYWQDANLLRNQAENSLMDNLAGMFNNIISNQMAAQSAYGNYTASPYQVNIPDMSNYLSNTLSSAGLLTGGQNPNENVSIDNPTYLELLKKRIGSGFYV